MGPIRGLAGVAPVFNPCFVVWHSRPRLCFAGGGNKDSTEGGCATLFQSTRTMG